jgi:hypothetical protein
MKLIEWFFNLFFRKKAQNVKQEAFLERQNEILKFAKLKEANKKHLDKYSGRKKYVKSPAK